MLKQVVLLIALFILFSVSFAIYKAAKPVPVETASLTIGNTVFSVEVADTFASRARGLSGHALLSANEGMLFIFQIPGPYPFWMKEMTFPLDIVWIYDGKVTGFAENTPIPSGNTVPTFAPPGMVDMVLEINAGLVKQRNLKIGDSVLVNF